MNELEMVSPSRMFVHFYIHIECGTHRRRARRWKQTHGVPHSHGEMKMKKHFLL